MTPETDQMFMALADPHRRGLVEQLSKGPASVTQLAAPAAVGLPAVLKHLKTLEEGGIVVSEKRGRVRTYRMQPDAFAAISRWIAARESEMQAGFDRLVALMDEMPEDEG